jgi:hypothetical protein
MTSASTRRVLLVTVLSATAIGLAGCGGSIGARQTFDDTEKVQITDIDVAGSSGDVLVTTAATTETRIKRTIHGGSDPGETYRIDGKTLHVDTDCGSRCTVSYEIQAPAGVKVSGLLQSGSISLTGTGAVDLETHSGDVVVKDATGPVKLHATSGDIEVSGVKGNTTLEASSGDVRALNVSGAVNIDASSGSVQVKLAEPGSVKARVNSGDLDVTVPANGHYRLQTQTGSGDEQVDGITNDPAATNVLDLEASSGDLRVAGV